MCGHRTVLTSFLMLVVATLAAVVAAPSAHAEWHPVGLVGAAGTPDSDSLGVAGGVVRRADGTYLVASLSDPTVTVLAADGAVLRRWTGRSGTGPQFLSAVDVAVDAAGNAYVLDPAACLVHVLSATGVQFDSFGTCGSGDGELTPSGAYGFGVAPNGAVWVADTYANRIVRFAAGPAHAPLPTVGTGAAGPALGEFTLPADVSFAADGSAWVSEVVGKRLQHLAADGTPDALVEPPLLSPASLGITRIHVRADGSILLAECDALDQSSQAGHIRVLSADGATSTFLETGFGTEVPGHVARPFGVTEDADGSVVAVDQTGRVQRFHLDGPGASGAGGSVDVLRASRLPAEGAFGRPAAVEVASDGSVGVVDEADGRLRVFGPTGALAFATPPGGLNSPHGVAAAPDGTWWVTDTYGYPDNRVVHVGATGATLGSWGSGVGSGAQELNSPNAVVVDPSGDYLLVADGNNQRVQVVDLGTMTSVGRFGSNGNANGQFNHPTDLAFGPDGRLYVADRWGQRVQAFARTPGAPPTFAFAEVVASGYGEERGRFHQVNSIAFDADGELAVVDQELDRITWFDVASGEATEVYGEPGRDAGELSRPQGVAFAADGSMLVADYGNARVQRLRPGPPDPVVTPPPPPPPTSPTPVPPAPPVSPVAPADRTVPTGAVTSIRPVGGTTASYQPRPSATAFATSARGGSIMVSGTVADAGGGAPTVLVSDLDGAGRRSDPSGGTVATVRAGAWRATLAWSRGAGIGGRHVVTFVDAAGNRSTTSFVLTVDNAAPTVLTATGATVHGLEHVLPVRDAGAGVDPDRVVVRTRRLGVSRLRVMVRDRVGNRAVRTIVLRRVR